MMVSPQNIYEELKSKSNNEVLLELRKFRREISRLKKVLENPVIEVPTMHPSPDVQIKCIRQYINEAKRILIERGVEYTLTQAEQKSFDFVAKLSELTQIRIRFSGLFAGSKSYIITLGESSQAVSYGVGYEFTEVHCWKIEMSKAEFLSELEELYIGEWKSWYPSPILDGVQWEVKFTYANGSQRQFAGSNAYPYNFDCFTKLLTIDEEVN